MTNIQIAIGLTLLGAIFAALYNIVTKWLFTGDTWKGRAGAMTALHMIGASMVLMVITLLTGGPSLREGLWFAATATGVLNIGIAYAKLRARELEDVSLVTPIDSTTPAIVIVTAMLILGETTSALGWIGIWTIAFGTYTLNIQGLRDKLHQRAEGKAAPNELQIWLAPFTSLGKSRGVRWAFFAVALSTISLPFDGLSARLANPAFGLGVTCFIAGLGDLIIAWPRGEFKGMNFRMTLRSLWLAPLFGVGGWITAHAFNYGSVPYVGSLKRFGVPLTIVAARIFLREETNFKSRLMGGSIMFIGVILIALA